MQMVQLDVRNAYLQSDSVQAVCVLGPCTHRDSARTDVRHIHEIGNHAIHRIHGGMQSRVNLLVDCLIETARPSREQRDPALDGLQKIAQIVRHHGQHILSQRVRTD